MVVLAVWAQVLVLTGAITDQCEPDRRAGTKSNVFLARPGWIPMTEAVCALCKKTVGSEVEVREGEKLFHLYCFVLYKRQASPFRDQKDRPPTPVATS
jgi:hypothetical protein